MNQVLLGVQSIGSEWGFNQSANGGYERETRATSDRAGRVTVVVVVVVVVVKLNAATVSYHT